MFHRLSSVIYLAGRTARRVTVLLDIAVKLMVSALIGNDELQIQLSNLPFQA